MKWHSPHDFEPRPYQWRYIDYFDRGGKRACWVVHRRGGKDLTALHNTARQMVQRPGVYWHIFPDHAQGRKAIWEGFRSDGVRIMENVFPKVIRKSPRHFLPNAETIVELVNGSIWRLMGSDHMEVVGSGPAGVVFSEYSLAKPSTWNLVRPMLRENDGWASFIFTPRGRNHGWKLFEMAKQNPDWFCELRTLNDTQAFDPEKTLAEERAEGMPEDLIRQEYLCDWNAALVGSVYGDLLEAVERRGGVSDFEAPATLFAAWDLGFTDATGIWVFGATPAGIDVVDHLEATGKPLSFYLDELDRRGWKIRKHWLPHDARAHTLASTVSIEDQMRQRLGSVAVDIGPHLDLLDGIQASRQLLQHPMLRIHNRCALGVEALRAYHYAWNDATRAFSRKPQHNWSSHSSDAWRYMAVVVKASEMLATPKAPPKPRVIGGIADTTLDELWADNQPDLGGRRI